MSAVISDTDTARRSATAAPDVESLFKPMRVGRFELPHRIVERSKRVLDIAGSLYRCHFCD